MKQKNLQNTVNIPLKRIHMNTSPSFSIERYNGWIYSVIRNPNGMIQRNYSIESKRTVEMFTGFISSGYMMSEMKSFYISDDLFINQNIGDTTANQYRLSVIRESKKILKTIDNQYLSCRLVGDKFSFMLVVYMDNHTVYFTSALFDKINMTCKCCLDMESSIDGYLTINRVSDTPFYLSKKDRTAETILRNNVDVHSSDIMTMTLISECMKQIASGNVTNNKHTPTEMYFIKKVIKSLNPEFWPIDIKNWISPGFECYENKNFKESTSHMVNTLTKDIHDKYPLIDLGTKEMNFIMKYAVSSKNKVLSENIEDTVDLLPYFTETQYGDVFRYPLEYNGDSGELLCTFIVGDESNDLRIIILLNIPEEDITIFSTMDFENIKEFNYMSSCRNCNTTLLCRNIDILPADFSDFQTGFKSLFLNSTAIGKIVTTIIALYVVMKDRPTRTRMVTCTQRILKTPSKRTGRKQKEEYEFVVSRILKTTNDAKEYVARMNAAGHVDREYTIEAWSRQGHYRHTKNGGVVWIPPTTCHRQLPLTEKEIHIKL